MVANPSVRVDAPREVSALRRHVEARRVMPPNDELFARQRALSDALPDPAPLLHNIALASVEALAGVREPEQIAHWVLPTVYQMLSRQHVVVARRISESRTRSVRQTFIAGATHATSPAEGIVEGVVVVASRERSRAVAIRLEGMDSRWRATEIHIL